MKKKLIGLMLILFILPACKGMEEKEEIRHRFKDMTAYEAVIDLRVTSNKGQCEYRQRHFWSENGRLRIETIRPKELEGKLIISNGRESMINYPIAGAVYFAKAPGLVSKLSMGVIDKSLFTATNLIKPVKYEEKRAYLLEFTADEKNRYRNNGRLFIDAQSKAPICLEIYDKDKRITVRAKYIEFCYNVSIEDKKFNFK